MGRFENERKEMVDLLREKGIVNTHVLDAMGKVERHRFVLEPFMNRAYEDTALPIAKTQTISQPYTVAFMTQELKVDRDSKVLEIGTGSGYQAAVLAEMGCRVFTVERLVDLHLHARSLLEQLGYRVATRCSDGTVGWSEFAPYDGIIVTAAAPEVPDALLSQLSDGGRIVIPVGDLDIQSLRIIAKEGEQFRIREDKGFRFVPLIGKKGWGN